MKSRLLILFCILAFSVVAFFGGYAYGIRNPIQETVDNTSIQIASQTTVLFPSTLTYKQQTAMLKGTGLEGTDFIYVERQTGIDAITLIAIAAHESTWGTNYWAKNFNNVMSWGVSDTDPDKTQYSTKTMNVYIAARGLKSMYLDPNGKYYGGGLTLWHINHYYASDKNWANGVNEIVKTLESLLSPTQRMKRYMTKTELFTSDVVWDNEHIVVGWTFYKANSAEAIQGR
jgi:hypothetical protein